jgi:hypothetical protein
MKGLFLALTLGPIRYHHGEMTILDCEALESVACECHLTDRRRLLRLRRAKPARLK